MAMAFDNMYTILIFLIYLCCQPSADTIVDAQHFDKNSFPSRFIFGVSSSAYQYEGAVHEGGRGASIWDTFSHTPGKIKDGSNGDVAVDSYHHYNEDLQLLKNMGMDSYRISISWSRLLPSGTIDGGINEDGVDYYNNLLNEMVRLGIIPFVTLFHWDLPQALEDQYKGFLDPKIVEDFGSFAEFCFMKFGDRVKYWITLNEPWMYAIRGHDLGLYAPGRCSAHIGNCLEGNSTTEPYIVSHNMLLAHATAVHIYKTKFQMLQKGKIGITLNSKWMVAYSNSSKDQKAAARALDFTYGWYMDPIFKGKYPKSMRRKLLDRLPKFTKTQKRLVQRSYDFIGVNYYSSRFAADIDKHPNPPTTDAFHDSEVNLTTERNGIPIGEKAESGSVYVYPKGLLDLLLYTTKKYGNPIVYITENGIGELNKKERGLKEALNDEMRIKYHSEHLMSVKKAIRKGADVRGYFVWSLLDNFEWNSGYTTRFGLYYGTSTMAHSNAIPKHLSNGLKVSFKHHLRVNKLIFNCNLLVINGFSKE